MSSMAIEELDDNCAVIPAVSLLLRHLVGAADG